MPNVDNPHGLVPLRTLTGGPPEMNLYEKDNSAPRICQGDLVQLEADGYVAASAAGQTVNVGVSAEYSASTVTDSIMVYDNPWTIFEIQDDGDTTASVQSHIGTCCDIIATEGYTTTGISRHEIDISDTQATSAQLKILRLHNAPNNAFGSYARLEVLINEHHYKATLGI